MDQIKITENIISNLSARLKLSLRVTHPPMWQEQKTKTDYTIWNMIQGTVYIKIANRLFKAVTGDVILFYPGDTYTAYTDEFGCCFLYNRFNLEMGNRIDIMAGMNLSGIFSSTTTARYCQDFCRHFMISYRSPQKVSFAAYSIFISYIASLFTQIEPCFQPFTVLNKRKIPTQMDTVLDYIHRCFMKNITIADLAQLAGLSEKYFISAFFSQVGMTPRKYILQCKMNFAAEALSDASVAVKDAARMTGYADQYAFSKAFKKYYGESPSDFKQQFLN